MEVHVPHRAFAPALQNGLELLVQLRFARHPVKMEDHAWLWEDRMLVTALPL